MIEDFVKIGQNNENINEDFDTKVSRYTRLVEAQMKDKKYNDNKITKELQDILKTNKRKAAEDDELEVIEEGLKENDFKCPYSGIAFNRAMKHKHCKHNVDHDSLQSMCRTSRPPAPPLSCKCPVAGCSKVWKYNEAEDDEDIMFQMESFKRTQERSQKTSSVNATYVDEDEEYTHL